ncbi:MAG: DUF4321 domain-containing protein [Candidatus Krumholzibacteria bacterium]|nr:DUF4321 domain-containing protein [Candidatus Krumholzibacteria bacterium]MDP6669214.1 DUF4321 domain-containing protein [Candidatus Krumholzibacteria bacterium]MDP6796457.1 DUF4321 domain-containing protein [Candidatus Krumholzibacteria bacterium]MDP7021587.1 DUF4321 domain-containing protein [Candidatus Krumholzibacteria bacterium]
MVLRRKSIKAILLTVLLGIAVGTVLGDVLALVLPDGIAREVLTTSAEYNFDPFTLNLMVISFTFGFSLKFNVVSVLGIFLMVQLLKWSW